MMRSILMIGLAVVALAPLAVFVLQSRPVPVDVHDAHRAAIADLESTAEDYSSLTTTLNSAWESVEDPGQGARTLAARVAEGPERLSRHVLHVRGGGSQASPFRDRYEAYTMMVGQTEPLIAELFAEQAVYLESVEFIRESGPRISDQMRRTGLDRAAADTARLVAGTLEYASTDASVEELGLRRLLVLLGRDLRIDTNMPSQTQRLVDSLTVVLDNKSLLQSKVTQIVLMPIPANVHSLIQAEEDLYSSTLVAPDQGRILLSIYVVLLLATAVFVAFRRKKSYR